MIICFLCAFLLGDSIIAALPLYTARELIFILLFWSAFTVDTRAAKMGQFALTMTFWVSSWFIYYFLRWGLDMLGLPSIAILGVLSLIILMAIAIYIFLGLVRGLGKDEGKSVTNGLDLSKASEGKAAVVDRLSIEFKLTERERELFPFLMTGLSAEYIAEKFTISPATVRTHAHNIYSKAGVSSQRKLIELVDPLIQQNDRERL
jgi:DNA-binding CsgD family transcriptional regulator